VAQGNSDLKPLRPGFVEAEDALLAFAGQSYSLPQAFKKVGGKG
jgi:hypothetical protein